MKTIFKASLLLLSVYSAMSQGVVIFNNRIIGSVITHVYVWPGPGDPIQVGNGFNDTPSGTTDWTGYTPLSGSSFFAQLLAANGANQPQSSLIPANGITTFRTGTAAGNVTG